MSKRNAVAVLADELLETSPPGAFKFTGLHGVEGGPFGLMFKCPCGCGAVHGASFDTIPPDWNGGKGARWHWDGNREKPTIAPSLGCHVSHKGQTVGADGYHWHGFLRAGVFEEC